MSRLCDKHDIHLSVHLSVTLVDCDHIVHKKWKLAHDRIGLCLGYMLAKANPDCIVLKSQILLRKISGIWQNVEFCTSATCVQWIACHSVSAPASCC